MPVCKKCGQHFPNRFMIDGKTRVVRNRKYCLDCSPFGLHNTRQIHIVEERELSKGYCKQCGRKLADNYSYPTCSVCYVNKHRAMVRQKALEYKGGKCCVCGYNKTYHALSYHHVNPNNKEFELSSNHSVSWERMKKELDKCILVCRNCHAEIEANLIDAHQYIT